MSSFWNSPAWSMAKRSTTSKKTTVHNPGPGNYNSALNIGKHQPSWKIGNGNRDGLKLNQAPGPGEYNLNSSKSGPKITMSSKPKINSLGDAITPGPGNYSLNANGIYKHPSTFTMGAKYGDKVEDAEPGPGNYNVNSEFKLTGTKIGKSKRNDFGGQNKYPGPGQYGCNRPFSAGPQHGFGNETRSYNTLDQKPGPGQYQTNSDIKGSVYKGCTIAQKYNKKNAGHDNPGPGSYDTAKRPMSGTKIGRAERGSQGTSIGPGPGAYDYGYKGKGAAQVRIGSAQRSNFGKGDTPGPGAYELLKTHSKGITISGFKGKQGIQMSPGPGTYQLSEGAQRPCSAKIGKSLRSNMNVGDAPGPGQYYPKQAPQYHFAFSKQARSKDLKGGDPGPGQYQIPATVPSAPPYLIDPSIYKSQL